MVFVLFGDLLGAWLEILENRESLDLVQLPEDDQTQFVVEALFSLVDLVVNHRGQTRRHRADVVRNEIQNLIVGLRNSLVQLEELDLSLFLHQVPRAVLPLDDSDLSDFGLAKLLKRLIPRA